MGAVPELTIFAEEVMADMFWEISAEEVKQAARWAMRRMCAKQRTKHAAFSISCESKHLDRVGTSAAQSFLVVEEAAIMRFLDLDLDQNVLFTAGGVVLAQGGKGVPIGGFISAQAAELWAMWRERHLLDLSDSASTGLAQEAWQSVVDNPPAAWSELCPPYLPARPPAQVVLTGPCDWTMAPSVALSMLHHGLLMTSPNAQLVIEHDLNEHGFRGWWVPVDRLLGTIQIASDPTLSCSRIPPPGTAPHAGACTPLCGIPRQCNEGGSVIF